MVQKSDIHMVVYFRANEEGCERWKGAAPENLSAVGLERIPHTVLKKDRVRQRVSWRKIEWQKINSFGDVHEATVKVIYVWIRVKRATCKKK